MDWVNKISWFFIALLVLGTIIHVLWPICADVLRFFVKKVRNFFRLRRWTQEVADIESGEIMPPLMTEYKNRPDGGMVIRTIKNGVLVSEERYTPREWSERKKVMREWAKENIRNQNKP